MKFSFPFSGLSMSTTEVAAAFSLPPELLASAIRARMQSLKAQRVITFVGQSSADKTIAIIESLEDPALVVTQPIRVTIERVADEEFIAEFAEAGAAITGSSASEALQLLKYEIAAMYDSYKKETALGPVPKRQLRVMEKYIGKGRRQQNFAARGRGDRQKVPFAYSIALEA